MDKWKNVNKSLKTGNINEADLELTSSETFKGEILTEAAHVLNTKKDEIISKVKKLYFEWQEAKERLKEVQKLFGDEYINSLIANARKYNNYKLIIESLESIEQDDLKNLGIKMMDISDDLIIIFVSEIEKGTIILGMKGKNSFSDLEINMGDFIKECVEKFNGKGGGCNDYGHGFIKKSDLKVEEIINYILKKISYTD